MSSIINKNTAYKIMIMLFAVAYLPGCETDKDDQPPSIIMDYENTFPQNCDTIYAGESFNFKAEFSDNVELGAYSLEIHNNFDHHTHSTEPSECELDPVKIPQNPWVYINQFSIPDASVTYLTNDVVGVPADIDPGDYHMYIRLTDKSGWQTIRGISIKIMKK